MAPPLLPLHIIKILMQLMGFSPFSPATMLVGVARTVLAQSIAKA